MSPWEIELLPDEARRRELERARQAAIAAQLAKEAARKVICCNSQGPAWSRKGEERLKWVGLRDGREEGGEEIEKGNGGKGQV